MKNGTQSLQTNGSLISRPSLIAGALVLSALSLSLLLTDTASAQEGFQLSEAEQILERNKGMTVDQVVEKANGISSQAAAVENEYQAKKDELDQLKKDQPAAWKQPFRWMGSRYNQWRANVNKRKEAKRKKEADQLDTKITNLEAQIAQGTTRLDALSKKGTRFAEKEFNSQNKRLEKLTKEKDRLVVKVSKLREQESEAASNKEMFAERVKGYKTLRADKRTRAAEISQLEPQVKTLKTLNRVGKKATKQAEEVDALHTQLVSLQDERGNLRHDLTLNFEKPSHIQALRTEESRTNQEVIHLAGDILALGGKLNEAEMRLLNRSIASETQKPAMESTTVQATADSLNLSTDVKVRAPASSSAASSHILLGTVPF